MIVCLTFSEPLTDKHYSLACGDDFHSAGCWNVSHQQQFFKELNSPDDHSRWTTDNIGPNLLTKYSIFFVGGAAQMKVLITGYDFLCPYFDSLLGPTFSN